jgi:multicomponent Na+:H+ antiporter subunit G
MIEWLGVLWMVVGAVFVVIAALGVARMPDLFTRMQASTKTGTAGAGAILLGTALFFSDAQATTRSLLVMAFLLLTAPIAAHLLARAGYLTGVPLLPSTSPDQLSEAEDGARPVGSQRSLAEPQAPPEPTGETPGDEGSGP